MSMIRLVILTVMFTALFGCDSLPKFDDVLPDDRQEYRKSRDLPPLEVPPDLTETTSELMAIPGEQEAVTLSEFQRQRAQATGATVLGKGEFAGEQWLALKSSQEAVWPELERFWQQQGFTLDLQDRELGVMETAWKVREENNGSVRERFRIFTETGEEGETMLYLSSEQQLVTEGEWFDTQADADREKQIIRALNLYFYGSAPEPTTTVAKTSSTSTSSLKKERARLMIIDSDRSYLALPSEYTVAWRNTQTVLERAGIIVQGKDESTGIFDIIYYQPEAEEKEKGLLDKLKFWGDDEEEGVPYQISLTGVGDKTEVIVNDEDGNWSNDENAKAILDTILRYYNQL